MGYFKELNIGRRKKIANRKGEDDKREVNIIGA